MPFIASNAQSYAGKSIGDGHCVAFVRAASGAPHSSSWTKGESVKDSTTIVSGTAIATFDESERYGSRKDGTCHAAIFLRKTTVGIVVLDQWITNGKRQAVHERVIRFNATGKRTNNGDEYHVVN